MPANHRTVAAAILVAAAAMPSVAVAEPSLSALASIEQLTTTTNALFVAADWSRQPVSADVAQITTGGDRFGAVAAYLDALGMQAGSGAVAVARIDQVLTGSSVAQLVQVAQVPDGFDGSSTPAAFGASGGIRLELASVGGNVATWSQTGNANFLRTLQVGFGNVTQQDQSGSDLTSLVTQTGSGNKALITQEGSQHLSVVYQAGQSNAVTIRQQNAQAYASVFQEGSGNIALIRQ